MGDNNNDKASAFFQAMSDQVSAQREQLSNNQGIDGTDLGLREMLGLRNSYNRFAAECVPVLASGKDCTTVFNTAAGKKLDVTVGYTKGVRVGIIPEGETVVRREVVFTPPTSLISRNDI